jgi:aspartyl-tRNA(Asn)/glutamyl-tRNA(Gln) amidotransferase subunit B
VELPHLRRRRLGQQYGLSEAQADFLCEERQTADYFEQVAGLGADPQAAALWLASDVQKILKRTGTGLTAAESPLSPERFAELLGLIGARRIHGRIAKQVLEVIFAEDKAPGQSAASWSRCWPKCSPRTPGPWSSCPAATPSRWPSSSAR